MSTDNTPDEDDDTFVSGELGEMDETVVEAENDGLDLDIVDDFNEEDFDEDFDDDFEEEIVGEYDLADDQYGQEFDNTFGHLTDPTRQKSATQDAGSNASASPKDATKGESAGAKVADSKKKPAKPVAKAAVAKKPARKK